MIATAAIEVSSYPLLFVSKLLSGAAIEPLNLGKKIILSSWFLGQELSLANNIALAFSREITFLTSIMTPSITASYGIT